MKIEVHKELVPYMIKYEEFRRYAEKFKKTEADQRIRFTYRRSDSDFSDYVRVNQSSMGYYLFC